MIVICRDDSRKPIYSFQKDYSKWRVSSVEMTSGKKRHLYRHKVSSVEAHTKETLTKEKNIASDKHSPKLSHLNGHQRTARPKADPRVTTLIHAFHTRYLAKVGSKPVITKKDGGSLKRLLTAGHDVPTIEAAMDRYFADEFYNKTGFDAAVFAGAFNRLQSAGAKKRHDFEEGMFPTL